MLYMCAQFVMLMELIIPLHCWHLKNRHRKNSKWDTEEKWKKKKKCWYLGPFIRLWCFSSYEGFKGLRIYFQKWGYNMMRWEWQKWQNQNWYSTTITCTLIGRWWSHFWSGIRPYTGKWQTVIAWIDGPDLIWLIWSFYLILSDLLDSNTDSGYHMDAIFWSSSCAHKLTIFQQKCMADIGMHHLKGVPDKAESRRWYVCMHLCIMPQHFTLSSL